PAIIFYTQRVPSAKNMVCPIRRFPFLATAPPNNVGKPVFVSVSFQISTAAFIRIVFCYCLIIRPVIRGPTDLPIPDRPAEKVSKRGFVCQGTVPSSFFLRGPVPALQKDRLCPVPCIPVNNAHMVVLHIVPGRFPHVG